MLLSPASLSSADRRRFVDVTQGGDAERRAVRAYMATVEARSPQLAAIFAREALARFAFAQGMKPHHMAGETLAEGMVPVSAACAFGGLIADDDPWRIRVVKPASTREYRDLRSLKSPSDDFVRYCYDVCQAPGAWAPFGCNAGTVAGRMGVLDTKPFVVIAGGICLNEALLPESARRPVKLTTKVSDDSDDVCDRVYQIKGPSSDIDNFLNLQTLGPEPMKPSGLSDRDKRDRARQLARQAVSSVASHRFVTQTLCKLCKVPIVHGTILMNQRREVCHKECVDESECDRLISQFNKHVGDAECIRLQDSMEIAASRSTINVSLRPDSSSPAANASSPKPVWQLTSRVYEDWRQVLVGFDLAPSQVAFDGKQMWMTESCAAAVANRVIPVSPFTMSNTCEQRVVKLALRYGLDLWVPGLTQDQYAAMPAKPVRGIQGIKWLLHKVQDESWTLDMAWNLFCQRLHSIHKGMTAMLRDLDAEMPPSMCYALARPYRALMVPVASLLDSVCLRREMREIQDHEIERLMNADGACDGSLSVLDMLRLSKGKIDWRLRVRVATSQGNPVSVQLDMVDILNYHTVNPGRQTFYQAQFDRYKACKGRGDAGRLSTISCYELWTTPSRLTILDF
jgi:hypothetical protein